MTDASAGVGDVERYEQLRRARWAASRPGSGWDWRCWSVAGSWRGHGLGRRRLAHAGHKEPPGRFSSCRRSAASSWARWRAWRSHAWRWNAPEVVDT